MGSSAEIIGVKMFGPLEVRVNGLRLGPARARGVKPKRLLEVLLLDRGRFLSKDRIAERLWGGPLPQRVATTVETSVSVLRRGLDAGPGLVRRGIVTEPGGYRLVAEELAVDLDRYRFVARRAQ